MVLTRQILLEYLENHSHEDLKEVSDDTELFSTGIVDSFAMVELLMFLEKYTGSKLGPEDIDLDNLDSISRILKFVERRKAGKKR
ncbi:MAG: acyl carrier protein [Nannocystaceae bacterium]